MLQWLNQSSSNNLHDHTTTTLRPYFRDHPGEPVPEESFFWASSGLYGAREDNKRQTHRQSGWAPLHLDQSAIHLYQSPTFTSDALPAATLPIYPGLGQAQEYAELHIAVAWFIKQSILLICECCNFRDCIDFSQQNCWWDPRARSLPAGKGKERKSIYIAPFCTKIHTKRSGMDHTVLPANNTMPAFPSWRSPDVATTATEAADIQLQLTTHLDPSNTWFLGPYPSP